jgi:hypothetical protein
VLTAGLRKTWLSSLVMTDHLIECNFLVPVCRDDKLSDGAPHERWLWMWLDSELFQRFGGATQASGFYQGYYIDPDTHEKVADRCLKFFVALPESRVEELRQLLRGACFLFEQKCIYLNMAGRVEFVKASDD